MTECQWSWGKSCLTDETRQTDDPIENRDDRRRSGCCNDGDRVPGAVAWNLYATDAKFADVEPVDTCVNYPNNVEGWNNTPA